MPIQNTPQYRSELLTPCQVELMLSCPPDDTLEGIYQRAILELLYSTAMKVSELISVRAVDVNFLSGQIFLRGGNSRHVPITERANEALIRYIIHYHILIESRELLFPGLNRWKVNRIIKKCAERFCFQQTVSSHSLRKSRAVHLLREGASVQSVKELLGIGATHNVKLRYSKARYRIVFPP